MSPCCRAASNVLLAMVCSMAVAAGAAMPAAGTARGANVVNEAQRRAVSLLALNDAEHAAFSEAARDALLDRLVDALDSTLPGVKPGEPSPSALPEVLAIGAPGRWEAHRADDLPLLLATRTTGLRDWQVSAGLNTRLIVTSLDDGSTWTRIVGGSVKRARPPRPSMSGPRPERGDASAHGTDLSRFPGVLKAMRPSWIPGRYALTAICFDWKSNTVRLTMTGGAEPVAVKAPVAAAPPLLELRDVNAQTTGIAFRLPARASLRDPVQVRAVVSLPAGELVLAPQRDQTERFVMLGSLLLVRLDAEDPVQVDLAIPVSPAAASGTVMTTFSFDARVAGTAALPAGTYQVYMTFGAHVSGPQPLLVE